MVNLTNICRLRSTKSYYCFRFFAPGMFDTSYINMQHLGAMHFFRSDSSFREIPAILYPVEASLQLFGIADVPLAKRFTELSWPKT